MKDSLSMETVNISANNEPLTDSQAARQTSVRVNEFEQGKYLFIPMKHFCVDAQFNGQDFSSKRVIAFKLNANGKKVEYPRTWKISYFNEMLASLKADGAPDVTAEPNANGLLRIPARSIEYIPSTKDVIPKSVDADNYLHINAPFIIDFHGTLQGYMARYERKPGDAGYNVVVDPETNKVLFDAARITSFSVSTLDVNPALIDEAKKVLADDKQLKEISQYIEC